jgi:hypothetical protein
VVYSCVLDDDPGMLHQALVWAWTAIDLAGVPPGSLVVHALEACDPERLRPLEALGVRVVTAAPFPGGPPTCNKLVQLESVALAGADRIVLCDCDVAWAAPLGERLLGDSLRAKIVDYANPSLDVLDAIFREAGLPRGPVVETSFRRESTYSNHCNGGLYVVPGELFGRLREPWVRWAHWVRENAERLGARVFYTDQMALTLALAELGERVDLLSLEDNCPTHVDLRAEIEGDLEPRVIHFHRNLTETGHLRGTGVLGVDRALERVNAVIDRRRG